MRATKSLNKRSLAQKKSKFIITWRNYSPATVYEKHPRKRIIKNPIAKKKSEVLNCYVDTMNLHQAAKKNESTVLVFRGVV